MKTVLPIILLVTLFVAACKSTKTGNYTPAENGRVDSLILRQICDYCLGEKSEYEPQKFPPGTLCLCYDDLGPIDSVQLQQNILQNAPTVKTLTIENPSFYIFKIPFARFTSLQELFIFGNDFNSDGLETFPEALLKLKHLKRITFNDISFDLKELERIKKQYPHIEIVGGINEYKTH